MVHPSALRIREGLAYTSPQTGDQTSDKSQPLNLSDVLQLILQRLCFTRPTKRELLTDHGLLMINMNGKPLGDDEALNAK